MSRTDESLPSDAPSSASTARLLVVDAADESAFRPLNGVGGIPGPVDGHPQFPDMTPLWREAGVTVVRSFDWVSRLDTRNNPASLFPDWDAPVDDPASYNFAATDAWVEAVHAVGAEVMFTVASAIPSNKLPAQDVDVYGRVVEHIVRHYSQGWAGGPSKAIRIYEFGDQPDFGPLHFGGRPEEFYGMYRAFCEAVQRVDRSLTVGGPALALPLEAGAPYREGFLDFVSENELPLDFFSFLWFTDASRDPLDYRHVSAELRALLDRRGFTDTELTLSYWNYLGVPSSSAPAAEKGAFQAATAVYLQDTVIDHAFFFRADSGRDPHYGFVDPGGIGAADDGPDERSRALALAGRALRGRRLAVTGGDESGLACAAGREGDTVRVLVANYVAPDVALVERTEDRFTFRIPIGEQRIELGFDLPPQRPELASAGVTSARIDLRGIPWAGRTASVTRTSMAGAVDGPQDARVSDDGRIRLDLDLPPQSVILVELRVRDGVPGRHS
ncbi:GH39 family glycosyl hydrolase [Microbacterium gilvum]|uniref:Glycosyl hydrolases family 39 N-terminal catalytic domain-containing protein n=1 Tax=Microbacterium gilvum TaxID=1336204 RepID=A0ABP9A931_9MICO